jgi:hypothetical protein
VQAISGWTNPALAGPATSAAAATAAAAQIPMASRDTRRSSQRDRRKSKAA